MNLKKFINPLYRIIIVIVTLMGILGIAYSLKHTTEERDTISEVYPRVEKLIAIYSILAWRHPQQTFPIVTENSEWGGEVFRMECVDGWSEQPKAGALFDCFRQKHLWSNRFNPEPFETPYISTSQEFWYTFSWESLFGYELNISVNPILDPSFLQKLDEILYYEECLDEYDDEFCSFAKYPIEISGLQASESVTFIVSEGYLTQFADGSFDRIEEWVVYLIDDSQELTLITSGALHRMIQLTLRRLEISNTNLAEIIPELEVIWMSRDKQFARDLISELESVQDLVKFAKYLDKK